MSKKRYNKTGHVKKIRGISLKYPKICHFSAFKMYIYHSSVYYEVEPWNYVNVQPQMESWDLLI